MAGRPIKNAKKRKVVGGSGSSQPKTDRFLQASLNFASVPQPMQVDSPTPPLVKEPTAVLPLSVVEKSASLNEHMLGTFRQQLLVPCIHIANAQPTRLKSLPDNFFEKSWETQRVLVVGIFTNHSDTTTNLVTASNLCESLCRYGRSEDIFNRLKREIERHVIDIKHDIPVGLDILIRLNQCWNTFCGQLSIIRNVFMELDRSYILPNTKFSSIIQLGKFIFNNTIMDSSDFRGVIVAQVLTLIKMDRNHEQVDVKLIQSTMQMMVELSFYSIDFEPRFLDATERYYNAESERLIYSLSIPDYITHAAKRRQEESNDRIKNYLEIHTKQSLTQVVTHQLIYSKAEMIITKGFDQMMETPSQEPLGIFYQLLSANPKITLLRTAFGEYIKQKGVQLIKDPQKDADMITTLIGFKMKLDHIVQHCFENDSLFQNALKESFEYFINTRGNKPSELLVKFIDSRLKKSSQPGGMELLDNALVLFRYIQGKDAFEAYYKRFLAKRLLMDRTFSKESEEHVIENLKLECGHDFTKNLESMFQDIKLSIDLNNEFKQYEKQIARVPIHVKVIQQSIWPASPASEILLPPMMLHSQKLFEQFYVAKSKGKKLLWQNSLSTCSLNTRCGNTTSELSMTLFQAAVLLMFNNRVTMTGKEMIKVTKMDEKELRRSLASLTACHLLKEDGDTYALDLPFKNFGPKFKVPKAAIDQVIEETKGVEEKLFKNRQHQLDAAIVRIMKDKTTCAHSELINEVIRQLNYALDPNEIKKRIDSLIDKDYLARDTLDSTTYIYQS